VRPEGLGKLNSFIHIVKAYSRHKREIERETKRNETSAYNIG
jgi:hypothetical protein